MDPLPRPPTSFIGRDYEVALVAAHIASGMRLISLTGLGGVGKTRLALAVGARLGERGLAVTYCDAVGLHSVPELAIAIAAALELEPGAMTGLDRVAPHVAVGVALARAARGALLVVIDNFEHLAQVATDALIDLLARAPELQLLVTTRVALLRPEELVVQVSPMRADAEGSPAVDLLIARARAGEGSPWASDRAALQRLAARLDGLPLALELAAARAHLIGPDELLTLLDERSSLSLPGGAAANPRRGSRDAAVAWSWDQLGSERQPALARLAVLGGSFDLELAAAVVGSTTLGSPAAAVATGGASPAAAVATGSRSEALEVLELLARYSLLAPEQGADGMRYRVLETVRDYVLAQAGPETIEAAYAIIAEALLGRVEPHLSPFSRELPPAVAAQVARDRDLYLAVLRRGLDAPGTAPLAHALRVAVALVPLFLRAGFGPTATAWTSALLDRPDVDSVPLPTRLGAALVTVVAAANGSESEVIDALVARVGRWLSAGGSAVMVTTAFGIVHYYRWDHPTLLALAESVLRSDLAKSAEVYGYALAAEVSSRRALGRTTDDDDARLEAAIAKLAPANRATACILVLTRAFLAIHRGAPERGLALVAEGLERSAGMLKMFDALFHLERARALHDLGRLAEADVEYALALGSFDPRGARREKQETTLDRAFLALEMGRYDLAAAWLAETAPHLGTSFEQSWHAALSHALAVLTGVPSEAFGAPTGTVEDGAFEALFALGYAGPAEPDVSRAAHSFRVRRALTLLGATRAINEGRPGDAIALALDGSAFRAGAAWVDLSTRPLIRALLGSLAEARLTGQGGLDREQLGQVMWPDERLSAESRDQRLHTAVSTLRRLGLDETIEAHEGGYRLAPERAVVRVEAAAWPGPEGGIQRARGRGRPPRIQPD